jgi:hypothetical protein
MRSIKKLLNHCKLIRSFSYWLKGLASRAIGNDW